MYSLPEEGERVSQRTSCRTPEISWPFTIKPLHQLQNFKGILWVCATNKPEEEARQKILNTANITCLDCLIEVKILEDIPVPLHCKKEDLILVVIFLVLQSLQCTSRCILVDDGCGKLIQIFRSMATQCLK